MMGTDGQHLRRSIIAEAYTSAQAYDNLRFLCDYVGGRVSGTENGRKAERYVLETLIAAGVDAHLESFAMPVWIRRHASMTVLSPIRRKLSCAALGNTPSTSAKGVTAGVVDVGYGTEKEFREMGRKTRGNVVLCRNGVPAGHRAMHRSEKMSLTLKYGGKGMIFASERQGALPVTGTCSFHGLASGIGVGTSHEDAELIKRLLNDGETVTLNIVSQSHFRRGRARNVVGEIRGVERPDEVVIVDAHLDSWDLAQGAVDNGTGSAVVMECARLLAGLPQRPKRTIRFILFMGEEAGLHGSKAYVRDHQDELNNVVGVLNLDMVGTPSSFRLHGCDDAIPFFKGLADRLRPMGMRSEEVVSVCGMHSDHQPFMLRGVPSFGLKNHLDDEQTRYYHSAGDTFDKVRERQLNDCSAIAAITLWEIANAERRPAPMIGRRQLTERLHRDNLVDALKAEGEWIFGNGRAR